MDLVALFAVQALDTAIDQARHAIAALPERTRTSEAEKQLASVRARIDDVKRESDAFESELAAIEKRSAEIASHHARLDKQLRTVIAPREAEALQSEMRGLAAEREAGDERGLELLDLIGGASTALDELLEQEEASNVALVSAVDALRVAEAEIRRRIDDLSTERASAVASVSPGDLSTYDRLRASHAGVAITRIQHGVCGGCHMDVSTGELDAIKRLPADQVAECPNCSRLLLR
jgi:predicted  nucleic acid-binding Zn-ribbon protein